MVSVLFVCLGNICRSPMAEAVFLQKVRDAGLEESISADSAGTGDWHAGSDPHPGTRAVLTAERISYAHKARVLTVEDFGDFDIVCTMDRSNLAAVNRLRDSMADNTKAVVKPLMEFAADTGFEEVPDPYYDGNFERTFELVNAAADGLLEYIRAEYAV